MSKAPHVPAGYEAPEGFVLVTERSWHGLQLALRAIVIAAVLMLANQVSLQLQVASRNRDIDSVKTSAQQAKVAAEAGTAALRAAIAASQGDGGDLQHQSAIAVKQIGAICLRVVGEQTCGAIAASVPGG